MPANPLPGAPRPVDPRALGRIATRLHRAAGPPWLHREIARRMAERLPLIKRQPACVLDWWSWLGASAGELGRCYPKARRIAFDPLAAPAPRSWTWRRRPIVVRQPDELEAGSAELLWANMGLHFEADIEALFARWHGLVAVDGFLMFSTLGPGSLAGLRELYRAAGWPPPMAPLVDMHDLGDMLVHAGFADPVMDQELLTLSWPDASAALAELRTIGGNAAADRFAGLRTPRWRERLGTGLDRDGAGRVRLELEIVYGHAFRPPPRPRVAGQTHVPLDEMRTMVRRGRRDGLGG